MASGVKINHKEIDRNYINDITTTTPPRNMAGQNRKGSKVSNKMKPSTRVQGKESNEFITNVAGIPAITKEQRFDECTEFDEDFAYKYVSWGPPLEGLELYRSLWSNGKYKPVTKMYIIRIGFSLH